MFPIDTVKVGIFYLRFLLIKRAKNWSLKIIAPLFYRHTCKQVVVNLVWKNWRLFCINRRVCSDFGTERQLWLAGVFQPTHPTSSLTSTSSSTLTSQMTNSTWGAHWRWAFAPLSPTTSSLRQLMSSNNGFSFAKIWVPASV